MKKGYIFILLLSLFAFINNVNASSIEVTSWSELNNAINSSYDTIIISNNIEANSKITISNKTVSIVPKNNTNITISRASSFKELFFQISTSSNVSIGNDNGTIIFDGSYTENTKQVLYITNDGRLNLNKVTIKNNNTDNNGSALIISSSIVNINNSNFENNSAGAGGAIKVNKETDVLTITNSVFRNNSATNDSGGAIYAYGTLNITNSIFEHNTAQKYGGAIIIKNNSTIIGGNMSYNVATENAGGAIRIDGSLNISDTIINNNTSTTQGAGINFYKGILISNNITLENNYTNDILSNLYPDPNSENNINWKNDTSLNLVEIDAEELKVFKKDGTSGIPEFSGITQGAVITDKYLIVSIWTNDSEASTLHIFDKDTLELVNTNILETNGTNYNLGHINDFGYDKKTGYIYAYTYKKENNMPIAARFKLDSTATITNLEYVEFPIAFSGIEFTDDYIVLLLKKVMYIYDYDFNLIRTFNAPTNLTTQGIAHYKGYIYYLCYEAGVTTDYQTIYNVDEKKSNLIYVYDLNGNLIKTLYIPRTTVYGEIEGSGFLEDGTMILTYNYNRNNGEIAILKSDFLTKAKEISIDRLPNKKEYLIGEQLDLNGLKLEVTYNSEEISTVDNISRGDIIIKNYNNRISGKQNITITYKEKDVSFEVTIKENKLLKNDINPNTSISNINMGGSNYIVTDKNYNQVTSGIIATGYKIIVKNIYSDETIYTISIKGDVSGDGNITPLDYVKIKNHIMETNIIDEEEYIQAADYNSDGNISPLDYVKVKNTIMNN